MKKNLLRTLILSCVLCLMSFVSHAQTNVSGGIYANTTWTKINSPYIVTDTVVVFPGVTLTLEPGVVVKFDDGVQLELRQAFLIAMGTNSDSITFTSNSLSPHNGSWGEIWLHNGPQTTSGKTYTFSYCNFEYATSAIYNYYNVAHDTVTVYNSNFRYNNSGIWVYGQKVLLDYCNFINNTENGVSGSTRGRASNCSFLNSNKGYEGVINILKNCVVQFNQTGITLGGNQPDTILDCYITNNQIGVTGYGTTIINSIIDSNSIIGIECQPLYGDKIINCKIRHNGIGISDGASQYVSTYSENEVENNATGIQLGHQGNHIFCNKICNNDIYDLDYTAAFGSNTNIANNYWCETDSSIISTRIHDGYDDLNLGLAQFMPIDTVQCFISHCSAFFNLYADTVILHNYFAANMANGVGLLNYVWSWGDGNTDSVAYPSHTYASPGFYTICLSIRDSLGCSSSYCHNFNLFRTTDDMVYVNVIGNVSTRVSEVVLTTPQFSFSPNPVTTSLILSIDETLFGSNLTITDITGRDVLHSAVQIRNPQFDIRNLSPSVYFVTLENKTGRVTKKLVKQ